MAKRNKADTQEIELSARNPRSGGSGRKTAGKNKKEKEEERKREEERLRKEAAAKSRAQLLALVLFALSILFLAFVLVKGENAWKFCHEVFIGIFGAWAILWPLLLSAVAVLLAFGKLEVKKIRVKLILLVIVIITACTAAFNYSGITFTPGLGYLQKLGALYTNGVNNGSAGLCSGIIGIPLLDLFGAVGARIFITILLVVNIVLLSGLTMNEILTKPARVARRVRDAGARHYREIKTQREVHRSASTQNYDDDYDFPQGTVYSTGEYDADLYPDYEEPVKDKISVIDRLKNVFHMEPDDRWDESSDYTEDDYAVQEEAPHVITFSDSAKKLIPKSPEQRPYEPYKFSKNATRFIPRTTFTVDAEEESYSGTVYQPVDEIPEGLDVSVENSATIEEISLREDISDETVGAESAAAEDDYLLSEEPVEISVPQTVEEKTIPAENTDFEPRPESRAEYHVPRVAVLDGNSALTTSPNLTEESLAERKKLAEQALAEREEVERQDMANKAQMALYDKHKDDKNTYVFPPVTMLKASSKADTDKEVNELQNRGQKLVDILKSFGVAVSIVGFSRGPSVTRYELKPEPGVKVSKITNLSDDIALNLAAAGVRIEAPIPGKAAVGIEVPNENKSIVKMRELIESNAFITAKSRLTVALGKDIAGQVKVADLAKMPHMLIAGTTGSGKSVCINSLIISLVYKSSPDDVKFLMVDPKVVELGIYNGIPHLLVPVVTDPRKAAGALSWAVTEMLNRYKTFAEFNVRDISGYNTLAKTRGYKDDFDQPMLKMPQIVIIIDELADLMMAAPNEVEDSICRLAQMARAAGMHLVVATQRPTVDVVTGLIKANIPSRIAFAVSSAIDSRTILDAQGAEKLLGQGDMLFSPVGAQKPTRIQGCFVSDEEIENIVNFIKGSREIVYDESINEAIERNAAQSGQKNNDKSGGDDFDDSQENDPVLEDAIKIVTEAGQASTSLLQRKLGLGYARAGRYIDKLEQLGIIGPYQGSKPRQVLMTRAQWLERNMQKPDELVAAHEDVSE